MPRNYIQVEIKGIQIDVDEDEENLRMLEITNLAAEVEKYMLQVQSYEIDTIKQALITAVHFAAQAYRQNQNEGGKTQEAASRMNELITKLRHELGTTHTK